VKSLTRVGRKSDESRVIERGGRHPSRLTLLRRGVLENSVHDIRGQPLEVCPSLGPFRQFTGERDACYRDSRIDRLQRPHPSDIAPLRRETMVFVYVPSKFVVGDDDAWQIVNDAGAGMLVIAGASGLASVFVPVIVSEDRETIRSHLAKANPWWESVNDGTDVLGLFLAASAYVTPSYYPSRLQNPSAVPTWNYVAAEVRGRLTLHDDMKWKLDQVRALTHHFEERRDPEWLVDDLDEEYRDRQLKGIVGIEIAVTAIEGKAKLSQNRPQEDAHSVRDHFFEGSLQERNVAQRMNDVD